METNLLQSADFETFFNLSVDIFCISSSEGFYRKVNPTFGKILGVSDEELLTNPIADFVHADDWAATLNEIERIRQGEVRPNFENRYRHKNGSYRTLSWSGSFEPKTGLIYCVGRDVTEQRHTEQTLHQFQDVLNSETIIAYTDIRGNITEVNDSFCEISGYSRAELIGQNHRLLNSGRHSPDFFQYLWRTISSGRTWSGMIENRKKNGQHYFVQSIITPIYDSQGIISHYLAIRFDVTKSFEVEIHLRKTLDVLNETGSIAKVGGWELDVASGELTWTDEIFNLLEVEKRGDQKPLLEEGLELFTPDCKPIIDEAIRRALEFGEPYSLELQAKTATGNVFWVFTNGTANYENGTIISVSGTIQDIDQRKKAEIKYDLERMKSIQNSKLASLGELSAGIAHEINNPLSIIYGSSQLISKFADNPEKLQKKVADIQKSCNRINRIVKSLKKFSRTNEKEERCLHGLGDIVIEAMSLTNAKSQRHEIPVNLDCQSKASIMCDEVEIEQVLVNLINNAIDA
ncbi:MAG: PAS domain S-box-containing protein, partial [Gammaproteobacteria bacterium]